MTKAEELAKLESQLQDERFLTKAPSAAVQKVRDRVAKLQAEIPVGRPCPNCGTTMLYWQYTGEKYPRYWCPRWKTLPVREAYLQKNSGCREIWGPVND